MSSCSIIRSRPSTRASITRARRLMNRTRSSPRKRKSDLKIRSTGNRQLLLLLCSQVNPGPTEIFQSTYRELRPRAAMPDFDVHFFHFANVNNTIRLRGEKVFVRLSDLLEGAPQPVLHAIAHILLAKLYRRE